MRRGDVVLVATPGDYGKPRPAAVIQSDHLDSTDSVLVCLLTSAPLDAPMYRVSVDPTSGNGLRAPSQVMVEKVLAVRRDKCGPRIGMLDAGTMLRLNHALSLVIGLGD